MDILSNLCITCLSSDINNVKITTATTFDVSYEEKLKACLPQYVSEYFDFGQGCLCERCVSLLDGFYSFLSTSMESKARLEEMIIGNIHVKEELEESVEEFEPMVDCVIEKVEDPLQSAYKLEENDTFPTADFSCRICGVEFQTKFELIRHSGLHLNYRPFICECGRKFTRKCGLSIHINSTKHTNYTVDAAFDGKFVCSICGEKFGSSTRLMRHNKTHLKDLYECECGKAYSRKKNLVNHQKACGNWKSNGMENVARSHFCRICGEKFVFKSELSRHYSKHIRYRPYVCNCGMEFTKKFILDTHQKNSNHGSYKIKTVIKMEDGVETMRIIENDEKKFGCCICGRAFSNANAFQRHTRLHVKFRMIMCECGEEFVSKAHLMRHQQITKHIRYRLKSEAEANGTVKRNLRNIKPPVDETNLCCKHCGKIFNTWRTLQIHMSIHTGEKPFSCNICQKKFSRYTGLTYHMNSIHEKIPRHTCNICGKGFYVKYRLKVHLETHDPDEKLDLESEGDKTTQNYHCEHCDTIFQDHLGFQKHMMIHTGEKSYCCHICNKKFSRYFGLTYHMNSIHIKKPRYTCDVCGKGFYVKCKLKLHLSTHATREDFVENDVVVKQENDNESESDKTTEAQQKYHCEQCDMFFPKLMEFQKHMMIHTGEKSYCCHICQKKFTFYKGLSYHMESIHEKQPKFFCEVCKKGFYRKDKLKKHLETHKPRVEDNSKCHACNEDFVNDRCTCCESFDITATNYLFVCECGKAFVDRDFFIKHRKYHKHVKYCIKSEGTEVISETLTVVDELKKPQCGQCGKVFESPSALLKHMPVHTGLKSFCCNICNKKFTRFTGLTTHIKSVHEKIPRYTCDVCGKGFSKKDRLNAHFEIHSREDDSKCHVCNENFRDNRCKCCESVDDAGTNADKLVFVCECKKVFAVRTAFMNHRKGSNHVKYCITRSDDTNNPDEMRKKTYCCDKCGEVFTSYVLYKKHSPVHTNMQDFSCDICGKKLSKLTKLVYHMKMQHGKMPSSLSEKEVAYYNRQNFTCDICGKNYYVKHMLTNHLKSHSEERNLLCNQCGATFYDIRYLRFHIANHSTKKPYPCSHCDKQFMTRSRCKRHMNQNHLNIKPYVCDICNEGFVDVNSLKNHKIRHSSDRPFFCPVCSATFKCKYHVKRHLRNKVCAELGKDTRLRKRKDPT